MDEKVFLEEKKIFPGFEAQMQDCISQTGFTLSNFSIAYDNCKQKASASVHSEDELQEYIEGSLLFVKNELKDSRSVQVLFHLLRECEKDNNPKALIFKLYEAELKQTHMDWKALFFIMTYLDNTELAEKAQQFFGNSSNDSSWYGKKIADNLHTCFFHNEENYFKIIPALAAVVSSPQNFLKTLELNLKAKEEHEKKYRFRFLSEDSERHQVHYNYFQYLCSMNAYDAANAFLDRIWDEKNSGYPLFAMKPEDIKNMLYQIAYPSILDTGLKHTQKYAPSYTQENWLKDVTAVAGSDEQWENTLKWLNITVAVNRLYDAVVVQENGPETDVVQNALEDLGSLAMYDISRFTYMTQICGQLTTVIQTWMLRDNLNGDALLDCLDLLGDKQIFSFKKYQHYTFSYHNYLLREVQMKCEEMWNKACEIEDAKTFIRVFFHTPLWVEIDLFKMATKVRALFPKQNFYELFAAYPIEGKIIAENTQTTHGGNRFQLVPSYLYWTRNPRNKNEKFRNPVDVYKRTILVDGAWATNNDNKNIMQLLSMKEEITANGKKKKIPTPCIFNLYKLTNSTNPLLLATDLSQTEADLKALSDFRDNLNTWFQCITERRRFIKWGSWNTETDQKPVAPPLPVKFCFNMRERILYAEKLLDTIFALADAEKEHYQEMPDFSTSEVGKLLRHMTFPPLEHVNDFRYIQSQHWTDFTVSKAQEANLYNKSAKLLEHPQIPSALKLEIYMNTCARKVYPLETLISKNSEFGDLLFDTDNKWIIPIKYMGNQKGKALFRMEPGFLPYMQPVIKSDYSFYFNSEIQIPKHKLPQKKNNPKETIAPEGNFVMFGMMGGMDNSNKSITLQKYFIDSKEILTQFPWNEYKKCLYDLKRDLSDAEMKEVYRNLSRQDIAFDSVKKYREMIGEMNQIFTAHNFNIEKCYYDVVMFLGKKNAFYDLSYYHSLTESEQTEIKNIANRYRHTYEDFLETATAPQKPTVFSKAYYHPIDIIGSIYYLSPFRLIADEETFANDLAKRLPNTSYEEVLEELTQCGADLSATVNSFQEGWQNSQWE